MRMRSCGTKGRDFRITITFTARCSESLIRGGSCWGRGSGGRTETVVGGGCSEGVLSERTALAKVQARGRNRYGGAHTAHPQASEGSYSALLLQGTGGWRDHLAYGPERNAKHKRGPTVPATDPPTKRGLALSEGGPRCRPWRLQAEPGNGENLRRAGTSLLGRGAG